MPKIGMSELLVILVIALIVFGPTRLPALGRMLGKTAGTLKSYAGTLTEELEQMDEAPAAETKSTAVPSPAKTADQTAPPTTESGAASAKHEDETKLA